VDDRRAPVERVQEAPGVEELLRPRKVRILVLGQRFHHRPTIALPVLATDVPEITEGAPLEIKSGAAGKPIEAHPDGDDRRPNRGALHPWRPRRRGQRSGRQRGRARRALAGGCLAPAGSRRSGHPLRPSQEIKRKKQDEAGGGSGDGPPPYRPGCHRCGRAVRPVRQSDRPARRGTRRPATWPTRCSIGRSASAPRRASARTAKVRKTIWMTRFEEPLAISSLPAFEPEPAS
jgi:hypothetical protein